MTVVNIQSKLQYYYKQQMIPEEQSTSKHNKKNAKKDLLKYEKPIYELKRNQQGKVESIIAKLMEKKQKPAIGIMPRSPLLDQLKQFMPVLKQSNNELLKSQIKPELQFDAKLEEVQDSSSSSSQGQDQNQMVEQSRKMQVEQQKPNPLESVDQFEFNILTYPYLNQKQQASVQTKNEQANKINKIVQIKEQPNHLQEME